MNRRGFLQSLAAIAATAVFDPEALLWVPGQKTFFLPSPVVVDHTLLTISMITKEALRVLENNLTFTSAINRKYDDQFRVTGGGVGLFVNIRKPARYLA